jgi:ubiquitin carboxyl-terminal hydrolase 8
MLGISKFRNDNGISCYINSVLHILQQLPFFVDYILLEKYLDDISDKNFELKNLIIYELYRVLKLSHENNNINITPITFKKLLSKKNSMWGEIQQQDSQEFLTFIISTLEEELGNNIDYIPGKNNFLNIEKEKININDIYRICGIDKNKKDFSIIKELFIGSTSSNLICKFCSSNALTFENFITLTLDIPHKKSKKKENVTLDDCLEYTFKDEQFDKDNKVNCDFCGIKNKSTKKIKLWKTPKILIIHLKRFKTNNYGQQIAKITNPILYPVKNLNLSKYYDINSPNINNTIYDLLCVNIHEELAYKSIDVGHYTSIVKNKYDNKWYLFNDSHEPILLKKDQIQNKNAYMLFYIKK